MVEGFLRCDEIVGYMLIWGWRLGRRISSVFLLNYKGRHGAWTWLESVFRYGNFKLLSLISPLFKTLKHILDLISFFSFSSFLLFHSIYNLFFLFTFCHFRFLIRKEFFHCSDSLWLQMNWLIVSFQKWLSISLLQHLLWFFTNSGSILQSICIMLLLKLFNFCLFSLISLLMKSLYSWILLKFKGTPRSNRLHGARTLTPC